MTSIESKILNKDTVYQVLQKVFPAKNDFGESDYSEELSELLHFGIKTEAAFEQLLRKHCSRVLEIDSKPFSSEYDEKFYRNEYGDKAVDEAIEGGFWYAFPALMRLTLELEFAELYHEFANS